MLHNKDTIRLFHLTVELIKEDVSHTDFKRWHDLIDRGTSLGAAIQVKPLHSYSQYNPVPLTSMEIVFSCWPWQHIAQVIETLPYFEDVFFENLSKISDRNFPDHIRDDLKNPLYVWHVQARRGLQRISDGEWGIWETLMYRKWDDCNVVDLVPVMTALQKLPKTSEHTLNNLAEVAVSGNSTTLNIGGMMALMVGTDSSLHSSEAYKKLVHLAENDGAFVNTWNKVKESCNIIEHNTISKEVHMCGRNTVVRKI